MPADGFRRVAGFMRTHRREVDIAVGLAVAFFIVYFTIGQAYREIPGYAEYRNTFFGADHNEAVQGWVDYHKGVHPLVLLLVVPLGKLTAALFGSYELGVVVSAAGFGALCVALNYAIIRALVGRRWVAAVITAFYGLSMSQLVFACIPDTYEISPISLMPTYFLTLWSLRRRALVPWMWVVAGVLSFSITITNVIPTLLCLWVVALVCRGKRGWFRPLACVSLSIAAIVVPLSFLQAWLIPGAKLFFVPDVYEHEMYYVDEWIVSKPMRLMREIFRSILLYSFIGQTPRVTKLIPDVHVELVYYKAKIQFGWTAVCAALLWGALWIRGVLLAASSEPTRLFTLCAALTLLFNVAMHTVYGSREMFLYTPHFIFALLWVALSRRGVEGRWVVGAWIALVILTGWNNLGVVWEMIAEYAPRG